MPNWLRIEAVKIVSIGNIKFLSMMRGKLSWHQARQRVLAENVANADTPGYRARDIKIPEFQRQMKLRQIGGVGTSRTNAHHIDGKPFSSMTSVRSNRVDGYEVTPEGNGVVLEEQMIKVTSNQLDYQAAASLYTKGLGLIRIAVKGRR